MVWKVMSYKLFVFSDCDIINEWRINVIYMLLWDLPGLRF